MTMSAVPGELSAWRTDGQLFSFIYIDLGIIWLHLSICYLKPLDKIIFEAWGYEQNSIFKSILDYIVVHASLTF